MTYCAHSKAILTLNDHENRHVYRDQGTTAKKGLHFDGVCVSGEGRSPIPQETKRTKGQSKPAAQNEKHTLHQYIFYQFTKRREKNTEFSK